MARFHSLAAVLLLACLSLPTWAENTHPLLDDRHTFILGAYYQEADAEFFADSRDHPSRTLDLGDLGLDEQDTSWMAEYRFRLNEKWLFAFGAYTFDTSGSRSTVKEVEYDGVVYEAGTVIKSRLEADTFIAEAMYKLYGSDRAELFVGGGFHVFDFSAELEGQAVKAKIITISTATFTAGIASYLLRAGSLVASLMSNLPLWRGYDPIAVFTGKKKKKKDRNTLPEKDQLKSETLFDGEE